MFQLLLRWILIAAIVLVYAHEWETCRFVPSVSREFIVERCMTTPHENMENGFVKGHYDVWINQSYPTNVSTVIAAGRLAGFNVQAFKVIRYHEENRIELHFWVPVGFTYHAFAELTYRGQGFAIRGVACTDFVLLNETIFVDKFSIPLSNSANEGEKNSSSSKRACEYKDYQQVRKSFWHLTEDLMPRQSYLTANELDQTHAILKQLKHSKLMFHECEVPTSALRFSQPPINKAANWIFIGDSQMRHFAETIEFLNMTNYDAARAFYGNATDASITNAGQKKMDFFWSNFGLFGAYQKRPANLRLICDVAIYSFGQWTLSWPAIQEYGHVWSMEMYEREVEKDLRYLQSEMGPNRVLWLTPNPHGIIKAMFTEHFSVPDMGENVRDFRSGYNLRLLAETSIRVCKRLNVSYIDTFGLAEALLDTAYDGDHYHAPVGTQLTEIVYNVALAMSMKADKENTQQQLAVVLAVDGWLMQCLNDKTVYLIQNQTRREFSSAQSFMAMGFDFSNVRKIAPNLCDSELYYLEMGKPI